MAEMYLTDVLRATHVDRWVMVGTLRRQNLAEHSFNVTMIALRICHHMGTDPVTRDSVMWYAMTHDLSEVFTGDIPTPVKKMSTELTRQLACVEDGLTYNGRSIKPVNPLITAIVKCADYIEALRFLARHNGNSVPVDLLNVYNSIYDDFNEYLESQGKLKKYVQTVFNEALSYDVTRLADHA